MKNSFVNSKQFEGDSSLLMLLMEAMPLCLNLWNRNFENTMCNKAALDLFDLQNADQYLKGFNVLSPECQPDGQPSPVAALGRIRQAFETGRCQFQWLHCKPDGELIPAEITLVRIDGLDDDGNDMVAGFTRDLRPQLLVEQTERNATQRIKAVLDATPLTCLLLNIDDQVVNCNRAAVTMFGARDKADVMEHFDQFLPERQLDGLRSQEEIAEKLREVRERGACTFEWVFQNRKKDTIPCAVSMVVLHVDKEDLIVAYNQDLRELNQTLELNKRLQQMAYFDWLTGSVSRARFMEDCTTCVHSLRQGDLFALLIFDFDDFKSLNDTYGHEFGDTVLKSVVKEVMSFLPPGALLGRYGGDEFLIQIRNIPRLQLEKLTQAILSVVRDMHFSRGEETIMTTISIGGAFWNPSDIGVDTLFNRADQALYEAKNRGRSCSVIL